MRFDEFLNQAWNEHATQAQQLAGRIAEGIQLIERADQIPKMAQLITHVFGEHLGRWGEGILVLMQLAQVKAFEIGGGESERAITRSIASLELAGGMRDSVDDLSNSDQIRVLATTASALSEQRETDRAQNFLRQALELAQTGLPKEDPANRALAVAANNLACALEERASLNSIETELMILAAQTARRFWEVAGTWLQVERAEYRLAKTYLQAGDLSRSLEHAQTCLKIAEENDAPALELFFGCEALALVERDRGNSVAHLNAVDQARSHFAKLSMEDQEWCEATLGRLKSDSE